MRFVMEGVVTCIVSDGEQRWRGRAKSSMRSRWPLLSFVPSFELSQLLIIIRNFRVIFMGNHQIRKS